MKLHEVIVPLWDNGAITELWQPDLDAELLDEFLVVHQNFYCLFQLHVIATPPTRHDRGLGDNELW